MATLDREMEKFDELVVIALSLKKTINKYKNKETFISKEGVFIQDAYTFVTGFLQLKNTSEQFYSLTEAALHLKNWCEAKIIDAPSGSSVVIENIIERKSDFVSSINGGVCTNVDTLVTGFLGHILKFLNNITPDEIKPVIQDYWVNLSRADYPKLKLELSALRLLADVVHSLFIKKQNATYYIKDLSEINGIEPQHISQVLNQLTHILDLNIIPLTVIDINKEEVKEDIFAFTLSTEGKRQLEAAKKSKPLKTTKNRKEHETYH